jgi:protein-disulfide isomerase
MNLRASKQKDTIMLNSWVVRRTLAGIWISVVLAACNGAAGKRTVDNSEARKQQILMHLTQRHSQLAQLSPRLGDIERMTADFDRATMFYQARGGEQKQTLLVSPDNKALYIIMDGPIDASRSIEELKAEQQKARDERSKALADAAAKLPVRGGDKAPVTIIEFSDFQCPYCLRGFQTMEQVMAKYNDKVRFVFMNYPLPFHPWAKAAAIAATCAANQKPEAFWTLHDNFFKNQNDLTPENVVAKSSTYLASSGIDLAKWKKCAGDTNSEDYKTAAKAVDDSMALGQKNGVEGTPAFFVNGEFINGAQPPEAFAAIIDKMLPPGQQPAPAAPAAPAPQAQ